MWNAAIVSNDSEAVNANGIRWLKRECPFPLSMPSRSRRPLHNRHTGEGRYPEGRGRCYDVRVPTLAHIRIVTMPDVRATIHRIIEAAEAFLRNLEADQKAQATFPFDHDERENWHYVPRPRAGLARGEMTPAQLNAAESLMAVSLSAEGLRKAHSIVRQGDDSRRAGSECRHAAIRPSGGAVLLQHLRDAGERRAMGMAGRRPPSLSEHDRHRRREDIGNAILLRSQPGGGAHTGRTRACAS